MPKMIFQHVFFVMILGFTSSAFAIRPILNFSDLISGPDTGLEDGSGSGVVVTVWGQNLGSTQGSNTIEFCDSASTCRSGNVYYWKNADGMLPGGPANLYESHRMQEIAFSIPDSAQGSGIIKVTVNGNEASLPFTVRSGSIYHVSVSGDDNSGTGSYANPWRTIGKAENTIGNPGSTIYIHDSISTGSSTDNRAVYWNNTAASSGITNQFGFIAFPNSQPTVTGISGFLNYNTAGQVVSKFSTFTSECDELPNGQPGNCDGNKTYGIQSTAFGRAVGNKLTDRVGGCSSGAQGAISGNARDGDRVSDYQILGNELYEYGCYGSDKLHHTTYFSIRSNPDNTQVGPWHFGWNYLHDNHVKNGIHSYDETGACGDITGKVLIHNNVIINQAGSGINVGSACGWSNDWDIYNNILINTGLASDWNGINVETSNGPNTSAISIQDDGLTGLIRIFNNTVIKWNDDNLSASTQSAIGLNGSSDNLSLTVENNAFSTNKDLNFIAAGYQADLLLDNPVGTTNLWHFSGPGTPINAIHPGWDSNVITGDPLITVLGEQVKLEAGSVLIDQGTNSILTHDIYGIAKLPGADIGAVEFLARPMPPILF